MWEILLQIREDIQTKPIEVATSSSDVADEEQLVFRQANVASDSELQFCGRRVQPQKNVAQRVANEEPFRFKKN